MRRAEEDRGRHKKILQRGLRKSRPIFAAMTGSNVSLHSRGSFRGHHTVYLFIPDGFKSSFFRQRIRVRLHKSTETIEGCWTEVISFFDLHDPPPPPPLDLQSCCLNCFLSQFLVLCPIADALPEPLSLA